MDDDDDDDNAPRLWPSDVRSLGSFSMLDLSTDVAMATK